MPSADSTVDMDFEVAEFNSEMENMFGSSPSNHDAVRKLVEQQVALRQTNDVHDDSAINSSIAQTAFVPKSPVVSDLVEHLTSQRKKLSTEHDIALQVEPRKLSAAGRDVHVHVYVPDAPNTTVHVHVHLDAGEASAKPSAAED